MQNVTNPVDALIASVPADYQSESYALGDAVTIGKVDPSMPAYAIHWTREDGGDEWKVTEAINGLNMMRRVSLILSLAWGITRDQFEAIISQPPVSPPEIEQLMMSHVRSHLKQLHEAIAFFGGIADEMADELGGIWENTKGSVNAKDGDDASVDG